MGQYTSAVLCSLKISAPELVLLGAKLDMKGKGGFP